MYGRGEVVLPGTEGWRELCGRFEAERFRGARAIVVVHGERFADSCGYSVPLMRYEADRSRLTEWTAKRSDDELVEYRAKNNRVSIDGLPALS
jgi:hypothetical protein